MTILANLAITTAVAATRLTPLQMRVQRGSLYPTCVTLQATFTYGSGGTTADAYVQTSLDGGTTWCDVANFHFATTTARKIFNLNSTTSVTTQATPSDGSLTANTVVDGIIGPLWAVKYVTTGTYGGSTTLRVDMICNGLTAQS